MSPPQSPESPAPPTDADHPVVLEATLRIDAPGPRKFEGVWLEHPGGKARWVVDYRGRELWRSFDGAMVMATGHCYQPFGQAINAPHFEVETLRLLDMDSGRGRFLSLGAERTMTGEFTTRAAPPGSKLAASPPERVFVVGGTSYALANIADAGEGFATVVGRFLEVNLRYAATDQDEELWLLAVHEPGWTPDPSTSRRRIPCP